MPKLVKDNGISENSWSVAEQNSNLQSGSWLVDASVYRDQQASGNPNLSNLGILVPGDSDPEMLSELPLNEVTVISVNFAAFTDGRGFSLGRALREQFDYAGELRASGYFLADQAFYLSRCGFDSFEIPDDANPETFLEALHTFSVKYQAAIDEPQPLFRRRS